MRKYNYYAVFSGLCTHFTGKYLSDRCVPATVTHRIDLGDSVHIILFAVEFDDTKMDYGEVATSLQEAMDNCIGLDHWGGANADKGKYPEIKYYIRHDKDLSS